MRLRSARATALPRSPRDMKMVLTKPTEYKVVSKEKRKLALAPKKSALKAAADLKGTAGQKLKMTFAGETPLGDDDFDAAG